MESVRLGIVGCGVIGQVHAKFAKKSPLIDLVAVADVREDEVNAVAQEHQVKKAYTQAQELFADPDVQAVVLALPANLRLELGLQALAAGKHLLTEKPVALNVGEVKQLIQARKKARKIAGCCSARYSFIDHVPLVKAVIAEGKLGDLRVVRARTVTGVGQPPKKAPPAWRVSRSLNGGGIMSNWGCYDLDYLMTITSWKLRPRTVLARTWAVAPHLSDRVAPGSDAETHFAAFIACDGGVALTHERGESLAARTDMAWQIVGTKGSLQLSLYPGEEKTISLDVGDPQQGIVTTPIWKGTDSWDHGSEHVLRDFAEAIQQKRETATSLERALVIQKITDALYQSADTGKAVNIR
jgi:predicted dehydrogenase